ncbi:Ferredoxin--NADP reductase [uncultured Gammaproteobacteria bacterium]
MSGCFHRTDVVIIGAGPVGLFAVFQCGMLRMKCHVIDTLEAAGGQCGALYPEKPIFDIPSHPRIEATDLVHRLCEQAAPFGPVYHFGQQATKLTPTGDGGWWVNTSKDVVIEARAVIIAAGAGAFGPNRPPLDGLEAYEGRSVFYMVRRRLDFAGKRVVIAGGGDSAVDWALSLSSIAERVMVVHRRPKFRAAPDNCAKLDALAKEGVLDLVVPYQLAGLDGVGGHLSAVRVADLDGNQKSLEADAMLAFFGLATSLGPIESWGLTLDHHRIPINPANGATNLPGVFAVGDIVSYPGKLKLILTGFAEAAQAAHATYGHVFPGETPHFEHSTSHGIPGRE